MADYIIDIWKDDELVQSGTGKWMEDEARRLTIILATIAASGRSFCASGRRMGGRRKMK